VKKKMNKKIEKVLDALTELEANLLAEGIDLESILSALELRAHTLRDEVDGPDESVV